MWKGGRLQKELPRYQYQRVRWQQEGKDNVALAAQIETIIQGLATLMASFFMYRTLVYTTGAIPAEYYSAQKRPGYQAYQQRTNRFFPGRPKPIAKPSQHQ